VNENHPFEHCRVPSCRVAEFLGNRPSHSFSPLAIDNPQFAHPVQYLTCACPFTMIENALRLAIHRRLFCASVAIIGRLVPTDLNVQMTIAKKPITNHMPSAWMNASLKWPGEMVTTILNELFSSESRNYLTVYGVTANRRRTGCAVLICRINIVRDKSNRDCR